MNNLLSDFAKKYLTYSDFAIDDVTATKKISFINLGKNVYIADIDEFVVRNPKYKKFLAKYRQNVIWQYEYVILVKTHSIIKKPIKLPHFGTQEKIHIIVEDQAEVTIDDMQSADAPSICAINLFVGNNAKVYYRYASQKKNNNSTFFHFDSYVQKDSYCFFMPIITHDEFTQLSLNFYLQQAGANANIAGYYWLKNKQQCALNVLQHHQAPHTKSNLAINGVLFDGAQAVYEGTILIDENANDSVAEQSNKNILLGQQARAVSVPNLEVKTNDVQCKHGSAVGKLDADQLFYMQSRGIALKIAKKMLLESFINEPFKNNDENKIKRLAVATLIKKR